MARTVPAPKPAHLGPQYAAQWQDESVVRAYPHRPPYGSETFRVLLDLIPEGAPRRVLDAGCGTGDLARHLVPHVAAVDAVDASAAMIALGRTLPGGDASHLAWFDSPMEVAPVDGPYGLIVSGEAIHWMDWAAVFEQFTGSLAPDCMLAMCGRLDPAPPWQEALRALIREHSTNVDFVPYDPVEEVASRGYFEELGRHRTGIRTFEQSMDDHIEAIHSRNGFSRDRMPDAGKAFDEAYRALLERHGAGKRVVIELRDEIVWGRPLRC